jgi:hypothetical protein
MVVLALGIFLLGAIALGIDGSRLYAERVLAQAAADAAAQAAMMSVFNGTNTTGAAAFPATPGGSFPCPAGSPMTPCVYAQKNGFGTTADTVIIDFPLRTASVVPADVILSTTDETPLVRATVSRVVDTTLMRLLGSTSSTVKAIGIAAILDVVAPVPILVTHPSNDGSFSMNGNPTVTICGGPGRSIQVNSSSAISMVIKGGPTVDLSKAGPKDSKVSPCTTGTGADFGDLGGPAGPSSGLPWMNLNPPVGQYIQPASVIHDPLYQVPAPSSPQPLSPTRTTQPAIADGVDGCPSPSKKACALYQPGLYPSGIDLKNQTAVFAPGIYEMGSGNGFQSGANGHMVMCTNTATCPTTTNTGSGMLVYNNGGGPFNVGANGDVNLLGTPDTSVYKGILFFQDRAAATTQHKLGGGGDLKLTGTIYLTNTLASAISPVSPLQHLLLQGNPGNTTLIIGMIIVSELELGGNAEIIMRLDPDAHLHLRQVALVK